MKRIFVDSNVFLRFFTLDDQDQHRRAADLFRSAAGGEIELVTGPPVLFEIVWTLRSAYNQTRETTLEVLSRLAAMPGLHLTDRTLVENAVALARHLAAEFADAYILVSARHEGIEEIATFNAKHFRRLGAKVYPD